MQEGGSVAALRARLDAEVVPPVARLAEAVLIGRAHRLPVHQEEEEQRAVTDDPKQVHDRLSKARRTRV